VGLAINAVAFLCNSSNSFSPKSLPPVRDNCWNRSIRSARVFVSLWMSPPPRIAPLALAEACVKKVHQFSMPFW